MRTTTYRFVLSLLLVGTAIGSANAAPAGLTTFTENFEDGNNTGGWTFGNTFEAIEPDGGNPGAFLHNFYLDTFAAQPRTTLGVVSPFTGDYRARGVAFVGIDLALFAVDFSAEGRPLSVILFSDADTPGDTADDCRVFKVGGHPTPMPNGSWAKYRFRIPSDSVTLPQGWSIQGCAGKTDDEAWNEVIADVDQLRFFTGDPDLFFIFQVFDIGIDNPTVVSGTPDP